MNEVHSTPVLVWTPHPGQGGQVVRAQARIDWWRIGGEVRMRATGLWEPVEATALDVFRALWGIRDKLPEVNFFVQGARRDAWHGTAQYPCDIDQAVLCTHFGQPPQPAAVPVLAPLPEGRSDLIAPSCLLHLLYHREWAGEVPPGGLTWTGFQEHLRSSGQPS
ncbi:hypothetical protein [Saccharopolyspora sp. NPDC002376]